MKIIGIIGSRRRDSELDYELLKEWFYRVYEPGDCIVSGGCPKGGDRFAEILADECWMSVCNLEDGAEPTAGAENTLFIHNPKWEEHGKVAGFYRNTFIARDADILIALVAEDRKGGTEDTLRKHIKGVQIILQ